MKTIGVLMIVAAIGLWLVGLNVFLAYKPKSYWFVSYNFSVPEKISGSGRIVVEIKGKEFLISKVEDVIREKLGGKNFNSATIVMLNRIRISKKEYESDLKQNEPSEEESEGQTDCLKPEEG